MRSVVISDIQERVRQLCDLPAYSDDTPITTATILDFARLACTLLAGIAREQSAQMLLGGSTQLTTTAGVSQVSIPTEVEDLLRISWLKEPSQEIALEVADSDSMKAYPNAWGGVYPIRYRLIGQAVELFPTPDQAYTLNVYYQGSIYITAATDTVLMRDGWDQWIALQMCILVRARQQKDSSDFAAMLAMLDSDVKKHMRKDRFAVRQIRDQRALYDRMRTYHGRWY